MDAGACSDGAGLRERLQSALGRAYAVERELDGGGMARVFVAEDVRLGRRVVVKVLPPDLAAGLSAARFEREIRLEARLQHPHVLPLLSAGDVDGLPYYTTPYIEGETLRARLARPDPLPIADAVRLVRELADALAYAHDAGVVHRDLKPENVLLSGGHAVVADFGVAKALASATHDHGTLAGGDTLHGARTAGSVTGLGEAVGTPAYMAPEQIAADPATDHRADLYALGIVAYELLAGVHPFAGRPRQAMLAAQLSEAPAPITERRPEVSAALAAFVARLLAKHPDDRPKSAGEVVLALDALPPAASGLPRASRPWPVRRPWRTRLALVGIVLVIVGLGAAVRARRDASPGQRNAVPQFVEGRVAVAPFENATGDTALAPLGRLMGDWITQGIAEAGFAEVVDPQTVRLASTAGGGARDLGAATRARLVVSGSYYRDGDSLRVLARITDAAEDKLLRGIEPVSAPAAHPSDAVAAIRERVLGSVGWLLDARTATFATTSDMPPSLAAYRQWSAGVEHFYVNEFRDAISAFAASTRADSTFVVPVLWAAAAFIVLDSSGAADSLLRLADRSRARLLPSDRHLLDAKRAELRGDFAGGLRAAREMGRLAPGSVTAVAVESYDAIKVNRPHEALAALARVDPDRPPIPQYPPYWDALTLAHHEIGDYKAELRSAARGLAQHPDVLTLRYAEARALAALGRVEDVLRRLDDAANLPRDTLYAFPEVMRAVGTELRAHGQAAAADTVFARAIRWYAVQPVAERATRSFRARQAELLYTAGRWDEARRLFEAVQQQRFAGRRAGSHLGMPATSAPDELDVRGYLGVLAARRGDRASALATDRALASVGEPYLLGRPTYWRARIAALLGERERAVTLLRAALSQGRTYPMLHGEDDLAPLRDMPSFRELMRVKG